MVFMLANSSRVIRMGSVSSDGRMVPPIGVATRAVEDRVRVSTLTIGIRVYRMDNGKMEC